MLSALQGMDAGFLLMLQNARTDWLDPLAAGYTSLGNAGVIWIAISLAMLCHRSTRPAGMLALCAMLLGLVCTNLILKPLIMRPRPWLDVVGLIPLINEADPNSFPSGHTCAAFAAAMIFWRPCPASGWGCGVCWWSWPCAWACPGCMWASTTPAMCWPGRWWVPCAPGRCGISGRCIS